MNSYYKELYKGQVEDQSNQEMTAREYSNTLLDNYMKAIGAREQSIQQRKQQLGALPEQNNEVTFQNLNLKPMAAFVDSMTGSRLAQGYTQPMQMNRNEELRMKLENAISKDEAGLLDDRLNVARLMNEDGRVRERMATQSEDKDLDRELRERLAHLYGGRRKEQQANTAAAGFNKQQAQQNKDALKSKESQTMQSIISFNRALQNYEDLVDANGIQLVGNNADKIKSAYSDLKIKYKEMANLGALTGPDVGIIVDSIAPATGASGAARMAAEKLGYGGGVEGIKGGIGQIRGNMDNEFKIKMNAARAGFGDNPVFQNYANEYKVRPPQSSRVRVTNGQEILEIDRSDLQDAMKDGFKEVK